MILDKNKIKDRHDALMAAFSESIFRDNLENVRAELYGWLESWSKEMKPLDERIPNVYSIESRIKGITTFEEKLFRNKYIYNWPVSDDLKGNQELIKHELTDLIGLRINCHFADYEKNIYDFFLNTSDSQLKNGFVFNFEENKKQKNGHIIYKFSGIYKDEYHFEVQIKSLIHNVWGEVEHKTVYKNPTYDSFYDQKRYISETLHDVMLASDKELHTLFNMMESEKQMLHSLYFIYTREPVAQKCNTSVLGSHYNSYFQAFDDIEQIKRFLICKLSGTVYQKEQQEVKVTEFYQTLSERVSQTFPMFHLDCLYHIDSELNIHKDHNAFLIYFLQHVIVVQEDDFDMCFDSDFNGQEEQSTEDPMRDYLVEIDRVLGTGIFKKEDNS